MLVGWSTFQSQFMLVTNVITWSIRAASPYHALSTLHVIPIDSLTHRTYHKILHHVGYATRRSELEWEPEETIKNEDIEPFQKVGVDLIKYFCHEHNLKLHKYDRVRDSDKQCQACIFFIDSRDFYTCTQCDDFVLHEVCANLPRKLEHASHHHPLFLNPYPLKDEYKRRCSTCSQQFSGFQYKCSRHDCHNGNFKVDIRCVLVPDCFTHKCHEHPLFINTCFRNEVCYKHDEHPLFLCYGEDVDDDMYWCETCEKRIDSKKWFYTCTQCCVTIHTGCILGSSSYMKYGYTFLDGLRVWKLFVIVVTLDRFAVSVTNVALMPCTTS
ncbi:unnamed protein product [Microthlaspi erraticum]|uniref:DC1 domain-containing protein n=1 Tax=Microthlaspi erraticum TaxID=1685480 RepID=A0A6D2LK14_9BRAS|nr:unnamed protein product [Microthlaspi erraticum]